LIGVRSLLLLYMLFMMLGLLNAYIPCCS